MINAQEFWFDDYYSRYFDVFVLLNSAEAWWPIDTRASTKEKIYYQEAAMSQLNIRFGCNVTLNRGDCTVLCTSVLYAHFSDTVCLCVCVGQWTNGEKRKRESIRTNEFLTLQCTVLCCTLDSSWRRRNVMKCTVQYSIVELNVIDETAPTARNSVKRWALSMRRRAARGRGGCSTR